MFGSHHYPEKKVHRETAPQCPARLVFQLSKVREEFPFNTYFRSRMSRMRIFRSSGVNLNE